MAKKLLIPLFLLLFLASCSYNEALNSEDIGEALVSVPQKEMVTKDVSKDELNSIIGAMLPKNSSRSENEDYSINLINDAANEPAIIVVNYPNDGGFVLVSASKDHMPVLAYNTSGSFPINMAMPDAMKAWLDGQAEDVRVASFGENESIEKAHAAWDTYSTKEDLKPASRTSYDDRLWNLSEAEYQQLMSIMNDSIHSWLKQGYETFFYRDYIRNRFPQDFPNEESFSDLLKGTIWPDYMEDYWAITLIRERKAEIGNVSSERRDPEWDQLNGFNQSFDQDTRFQNSTGRAWVGCGPIAAGQMMYILKRPSYIKWNEMSPRCPGNQVASDFLKDLADNCSATYKDTSTGTSIAHLKNGIKKYNYDVQSYGYSYSRLWNDPFCILAGSYKRNGTSYDHFWIAQGSQVYVSYTKMDVWTFVYPYEMRDVYYEEYGRYEHASYYLNWGWGGLYNGYYSSPASCPSALTSLSIDELIYMK